MRPQHVHGFLTWRRVHQPDGRARTKPLSNRTVHKDRAVLHRLFSLAEKLELREGNPVRAVDPPATEERDPVILTDAEYERLLEACGADDMLRMWVLVLGETGVRSVSEALWLRWEDVDVQEGFVWVDSTRHGRRTKSGKGRWVPLSQRLREAFRDHAARYRLQAYGDPPTRSPWVFHHPFRRQAAEAGDRIRGYREPFKNACEKAKLPSGFVPHDLRHRRVTKWLAEERNPVHVKEAMGHSTMQVTMRYTHLAREHLRSLVEPKAEAQRSAGS